MVTPEMVSNVTDIPWETFNASLGMLQDDMRMVTPEVMLNGTDGPWEIVNASFGILQDDTGMVTSFPWNVSDGILSDATKKVIEQVLTTTRKTFQFKQRCGELYEHIIRGVILGVIIIFGVMGNVLSILVMRHDIRTSATSLLFFVLALVDMLVLLTRLFVICIPNWLAYWDITDRQYNRFHRNYVEAYGEALAFLAQHWTTGMTVLVTVHRYMVVCRPTQAAKLASIKAVRIQMVVLLIAITVYNMPLFFQYTVTERTTKWGTTWRRTFTDMAKTDSYGIGYRIVMLYLMIYVIPVGFLAVLSYRLVVTVKKAAEKMKNASNRSQDKQDMTKTLVSIIIVYMICQLPTPTNILIREFTPRLDRRCPFAYFYFRDFDDVGICFNSAFNFVLYCLFGKRFRRHLKSILCGHKMRIEAMGATLEMSHSTRNDMSAENASLRTASTITTATTVGEVQNGKMVATTHK